MGRTWWRMLVAGLALVTAAGCSKVVTLELPSIDAVPRVPPEQSIVYDAAGNQLAVLRHEFREHVAIDTLPRHLVDAVVAAEDHRFFEHGGVDGRALLRAALTNTAAGEVREGGSTITQQLVKNLYMPDARRTLGTKVKEALLARQLESEHSKQDILEDYLNTVYFGNGAYGVQAAAETYWRTDASDLTVAQSALLAGIIRSPETLNPTRAPDAARQRRDEVLHEMADAGAITQAQATDALAQPVVVEPRPPTPATQHPYWVDFVVRTLLDDPSFGADETERARKLYGGGLRIHTTLDPDLQHAAEQAAHGMLPDDADPEVAVVSVEPGTGAIRAAVAGRDYDARQFDLATQGRRQPGSTFKTFVLAAAVTDGMGPDHPVNGDQGVLQTRNGPWTVRNYTRTSYGLITLRKATTDSVNGAFARLILQVGVSRVAALAHAMGVVSPINQDPPIALGGLTDGVSPLDMASAYATLANLGERVPVSPIDRIEDRDGHVVWRPDHTPHRVLAPSAAFVTTQLLQGVVDEGTGIRAQVPGHQVAGKTGTVQDDSDAWFVGYTPTLSTAVWVGDPDARRPMHGIHGVRNVTGGTIPASIFSRYMTDALAGSPPTSFALPEDDYEVVSVDPDSGLRAAPWCPGEPTPMPRVLVPRETCPSPAPAPPRPAPAATPATTPDPAATPAPQEPTTTTTDPAASDPAPALPLPAPTASPDDASR